MSESQSVGAKGASTASAEPDTEVDRIAKAALAVKGVHSLSAGAVGTVATYLPGRRVAGILQRDDSVEVHVAVSYGNDVREVAKSVQGAVGKVVDVTVNVVVEDVVA